MLLAEWMSTFRTFVMSSSSGFKQIFLDRVTLEDENTLIPRNHGKHSATKQRQNWVTEIEVLGHERGKVTGRNHHSPCCTE
jgi:hypothetical protein